MNVEMVVVQIYSLQGLTSSAVFETNEIKA